MILSTKAIKLGLATVLFYLLPSLSTTAGINAQEKKTPNANNASDFAQFYKNSTEGLGVNAGSILSQNIPSVILQSGNLQHLKKGVCYLRWEEESDGIPKWKNSNGFLVNTINNSYGDSGQKLLYLITASTNKLPAAGNNPLFTGNNPLFISFDLEAANGANKNPKSFKNKNEYNNIRQYWRVQVNKIYEDTASNIALYQIQPKITDDHAWDINNSEIFEHVYALGWSLHPRDILKPFELEQTDEFTYISTRTDSPKTIQPKLYHVTVEKDLAYFYDKLINSNTQNSLFLKTPNYGRYNQHSVLGSPFFNATQQVYAVNSHGEFNSNTNNNSWVNSSLLQNSWNVPSPNTNNKTLQQLLDPNESWISSVPGGYVKDLIKNPPEENWLLPARNDPYKTPIYLKFLDFFKFLPQGRETLHTEQSLGDGILESELLNRDIDFYVYIDDPNVYTSTQSSKHLLYGTTSDSPSGTTFTGLDWYGVEGPFTIPEDFGTIESSTKAIKANLIQYLSAKAGSTISTTEKAKLLLLKDFKQKATAVLANPSNSVKAIKLPYMMPYNAKELFGHEFDPKGEINSRAYNNFWQSYNYRKSKGKWGEGRSRTHIEEFDVKQAQITQTKKQLIEKEYIQTAAAAEGIQVQPILDTRGHFKLQANKTWQGLKPDEKKFKSTTAIADTIKSDYNGGYLNLRNPNYQLNLPLSHRDEHGVILSFITVEMRFNKQRYAKRYGVWLDFFRLIDDENYYNFEETFLDMFPNNNQALKTTHLNQLQNLLVTIGQKSKPKLKALVPEIPQATLDSTNPNDAIANWLNDYFQNNENLNNWLPSAMELVGKGRTSAQIYTVKFTYLMPFADQIPILKNQLKTTLRAVVANNDVPDTPSHSEAYPNQEFPRGEVEDYLAVISPQSKYDIDNIPGSDADIAHQNTLRTATGKRKRDDEEKYTFDELNDEDFEQLDEDLNDLDNFLENFSLLGDNPPDATTKTVALFVIDEGKSPIVSSFITTALQDILKGTYRNLFTGNTAGGSEGSNPGGNDPNNDPKSCPDVDDADLNAINFDPNNAQSWQHWVGFNSLLNNALRIVRLWNKLDSTQAPIPFITDQNGAVDWALYNQFVTSYNTLAVFRNQVNSQSNSYELLTLLDSYTLPSGDTILELAIGKNNAELYHNLYSFIVKYQCYMLRFATYSQNYETIINLNQNVSRVAIDFFGKILPNAFNKRTICNATSLSNYPQGSDKAVIYHAKGNTNSTKVYVDSKGKVTYELKAGANEMAVTSENPVPLNEEVVITSEFNQGQMHIYINTTQQGSQNFPVANILGYQNFTQPGNGARVGGPVQNPNNTAENIELKPLDGKVFKTFVYHNANYEEAAIDAIVNITLSANNTPASRSITKTPNNTSPISEVSKSQTYEPLFQVYPIPAKDALNIMIEIQDSGPLSIDIIDLTGRSVYHMGEPKINKGIQHININKLNIAPGNYVIKVGAGNVNTSKQVMFE